MFRRLLPVLLVLGLLAACGSDGESSSPTTLAADSSSEEVDDPNEPTAASAAAHSEPDGEPEWPLVAPEPSLPATVVDATGAEVTITAADRIGSMNGSISEIIWTLGLGDRLVVIDGTTGYPAELTELPNVGFFRSIPAEGVISQMPDVVFVPLDAGPPEALEAIEAAGIVLVRVPVDGPEASEIAAKVRLVGTALGVSEHAESLARDAEQRFHDSARSAAEDAPIVAYIVPRGQNVFLTGLDSPSNSLIAAAGAMPAAAVLGLEGAAPLTPEALVVADPVVIVSTATAVTQAGGAEAFLAIPGIAETTAARNGALIVWPDDQSIQQWTPRSWLTVRDLAEQIQELLDR